MIQIMISSHFQIGIFPLIFPDLPMDLPDFLPQPEIKRRPALVQQAVNDRLDQRDSPGRGGHGRHHTACHLLGLPELVDKNGL